MFNLFKKKEKNFDKFFDGIDALYLRLYGISQVTHPEQSLWFFNALLKENVKTKIAIVITYNTYKICEAKPEIKSKLLTSEFPSRFKGSGEEFTAFHNYISSIEDHIEKTNNSPEDVLEAFGNHWGYWLGSRMEKEYEKTNQFYKFDNEFLEQIGEFIADHIVEYFVPLIEEY
jgi:hypothetical protein